MNGITKEDIESAFRTLRQNNAARPQFSGGPTMYGRWLSYYYASLPDEMREVADEMLASNELVRKAFMEEAE